MDALSEMLKYIAGAVKAGKQLEDIKYFGYSDKTDRESIAREELSYKSFGAPSDASWNEWCDCIKNVHDSQPRLVPGSAKRPFVELSDGAKRPEFNPESDDSSCWVAYRNFLLGKKGFSEKAVDGIESSAKGVYENLLTRTKPGDARKGLVFGSVQSGKTSNMCAVVSMSADISRKDATNSVPRYHNIFIVLSGSLENLRQQTLDRFRSDLQNTSSVHWNVLDLSSSDVSNASSLKLDDGFSFSVGATAERYVIVCLKQKQRLRKLIDYLYGAGSMASKMRILVIDDEADQAGVNTKKMDFSPLDSDMANADTDSDDDTEITQDRTIINKLIVNLVQGKTSDGSTPAYSFGAMNYVSYTATPYANVLNESFEESLYPKDFVISLREPDTYFGCKAIFGDKFDEERYPGLDIVRCTLDYRKEDDFSLNDDPAFQKSMAWFLCAASIRRIQLDEKGEKRPISMLIHTSVKTGRQMKNAEDVEKWLSIDADDIVEQCRDVYAEETKRFSFEQFEGVFPSYGLLPKNKDKEDSGEPSMQIGYPEFSVVERGIRDLLRHGVYPREMDSLDRTPTSGINIAVDNSVSTTRLFYPDKEELKHLDYCPVYCVVGGQTMSRGLTLEGLVCTYLTRDSNQADTLMQMARWFGYRVGYELLPRVWMTMTLAKKYEALAAIDVALKDEFERYEEEGIKPSKVAPRVMDIPAIKRFRLTAVSKMQGARKADWNGSSVELTEFAFDSSIARANLESTQKFIDSLGAPVPKGNEKLRTWASDVVWRGVDSSKVANFLAGFRFADQAQSVKRDSESFIKWIGSMTDHQGPVLWDVAVAGAQEKKTRWTAAGRPLPVVTRGRLKDAETFADIKSLRSGMDVLCDVDLSSLDDKGLKQLDEVVKNKKRLIEARGLFLLSGTPLLLLYRIDDKTVPARSKNSRLPLGIGEDSIGFAMVYSELNNQKEAETFLQTKLGDWRE